MDDAIAVTIGDDGLNEIDIIKLCVYRRRPDLFVERELGYMPSAQQRALLLDLSDRTNRNFIISAGRGSGKTLLVSWAVAWSIACLQDVYRKYECIILGGSLDQSTIMYSYFKDHIYKTPLLWKRLVGEPTRTLTTFEHGYVRAVACSDKSVRGRHPELLVLDEVAGAEDDVVLSALPMILGSEHGRVVMLSTPHRFFGVFQDYWENQALYGYRRYGPWSLENLPWIDQNIVERARISYPAEKFAVEFLGEFPKVGAMVFPKEAIDRCVAAEPFKLRGGYDAYGGVDWGRDNPTVLVVQQPIRDRFYIPSGIREWHGFGPVVLSEIYEIARRNRVVHIWADASHEAENERLNDAGVPTENVWFRTWKQKMIEALQVLVHKGLLVISPDNEELIKQLYKYRWKTKKEGATDTPRVKKDEDYVDALMLSLFDVAERGLSEDSDYDRFVGL